VTGNLPALVPGRGLATAGHFASRTAELALQDQPVVLWQRAIPPETRPWVQPSGDVVVAGDEFFDIQTGRALPGTPPAGPGSDTSRLASKVYGRLLVTARRVATPHGLPSRMVCLEATDLRSGQAVWRHSPTPEDEFRDGPWASWMWWMPWANDDAEVLFSRSRGDGDESLGLLDPSTGEHQAIRLPAVDPPEYEYDLHGEFRDLHRDRDLNISGDTRPGAGHGGRVRLAVGFGGLAGVDEANGTLLWRIRHPVAGYEDDWKQPVYLGGTDRCLVLVGVVDHPPLWDGPVRRDRLNPMFMFEPAYAAAQCSCTDGGVPGPDEPNTCATCGGLFYPWVTVAVHDRRSGRRLWGHRWPDRTAPDTEVESVASIRGSIVLTREGRFLRARRIQDGYLLWSAVPAPQYRGFSGGGDQSACQWARLREDVFHEAEDLFVHALTGRTLTIRGAFHQTSDDLVLTRTSDTLTCLALPGSPCLPGTPPPATQGQDWHTYLDWDIAVENGFLPTGGTEVSAIVTVTATRHSSPASPADRARMAQVFLIDASESMSPAWLAAVQHAVAAATDRLPEGALFAIVAGADTASMVYPATDGLARADACTKAEARQALGGLTTGGGITISRWLEQARRLLDPYPTAIRSVLLLVAGRADRESAEEIGSKASDCSGIFSCECRGLGTDWDVSRVRAISTTLYGSLDIVVSPDDLTAETVTIIEAAMARAALDVRLRIRPAGSAQVRFVKQVAPALNDLTSLGISAQDLAGAVDYPVGSWGPESRDYHIGLQVSPAPPGCRVTACLVSVTIPGPGNAAYELTSNPILAEWLE